jgi:transposase-like protein
MSREGRSLVEKRRIAEEYLSGTENQTSLNMKYRIKGKSAILNWIRQFGFEPLYEIKKAEKMKKPVDDKSLIVAENQELRRRILELEAGLAKLESDSSEVDSLKKKLEYAEMSAIAYKKMIEIAEETLGIDIRKKPGAKQ